MTESISIQTPGQLLSAARQMRSLTQQEVARQMRLPVQTICDIDRDALAEVGARTYVRGYLVAYARIVDISEEQILTSLDQSQFTLAMPTTQSTMMNSAPIITNVTRQYGSFRFKSSYMAGMSALIFVAALTYTFWPNKKMNITPPMAMHPTKSLSHVSSTSVTLLSNVNAPTITGTSPTIISASAPATPIAPITSNTPLQPRIQHAPHQPTQSATAHHVFTHPMNGLRPTYTLSPVGSA